MFILPTISLFVVSESKALDMKAALSKMSCAKTLPCLSFYLYLYFTISVVFTHITLKHTSFGSQSAMTPLLIGPQRNWPVDGWRYPLRDGRRARLQWSRQNRPQQSSTSSNSQRFQSENHHCRLWVRLGSCGVMLFGY